jgi:hypothetical protein
MSETIRPESDYWGVLQDSLGHRLGRTQDRELLKDAGTQIWYHWRAIVGDDPTPKELEDLLVALICSGNAATAITMVLAKQGVPKTAPKPNPPETPAPPAPRPAEEGQNNRRDPVDDQAGVGDRGPETLALFDAIRRHVLGCAGLVVVGFILMFAAGFSTGSVATHRESALIARLTLQNLSQFPPPDQGASISGDRLNYEWATQEAHVKNLGFWSRLWDILPFGFLIGTFLVGLVTACFWVAWKIGRHFGIH